MPSPSNNKSIKSSRVRITYMVSHVTQNKIHHDSIIRVFFFPQVSMFLSSTTKNSQLKYCPQIFTPKPVYRLIRPTTALQITTSITLSSRLMFLRVDKNWPFLFLFQHKPVDKPRRANANRIPKPTKVIITRYDD